ncbi:response regulator [Dyadobacter psychrotolerans]|uniref:Response regulator transcription factor n=1 Tax=Dyadobacter psychrotolerans TaxID=2541721 RepID=A0A4R5DEZ8_9BACT|nr:response regulator transcription factor [Dyadobacter psychrotolerans]TDE10510.1 response regulator transcription factor [Dyadobacter psychrotolerans]
MNITLIDQHPILRRGINLLLRDSFPNLKLVQICTLEVFINLFHEQKPDLIIVGISEECPEINFDQLRTIRKNHPETGIIFLVGKIHYNTAVAGITEGIKGYVLKTNELSEVLKCIHTVLNGRRYFCPDILQLILNECPESLDLSELTGYDLRHQSEEKNSEIAVT